jgi:nitrate/TMAO reductase-like tetraheme cytochrome c subunit
MEILPLPSKCVPFEILWKENMILMLYLNLNQKTQILVWKNASHFCLSFHCKKKVEFEMENTSHFV